MDRICQFDLNPEIHVTKHALLLATMLAAAVASANPTSEETPAIPDDTQIITTPSGLQYSVLQAGNGKLLPKASDTVKVHYTGWLTDGTSFDSSRKRGEPAEFKLMQVIPGWTEGLELMSVGARYKLTIPSELAYGETGRPPVIPPKSTLIFDVELLEITPGPELPAFADLTGAAKDLEAGVRYEVLETGQGDAIDPEAIVQLEFTIWNPEGRVLDSSAIAGRPLKAPLSNLPLPFLQKAAPLFRENGRYRFAVPADQGIPVRGGSGSDTIWNVAVTGIIKPLALPAFDDMTKGEIKKTASGLEYKVIKEGTGATPKMGQPVTVHYAGWLTDGSSFDSSFSRGEPASFTLGRVIQGWNEGLQLMQEGGIVYLRIPSDLAYGERGSPPNIGPNETLIFYVELQMMDG